ncbi:pyridoxamine 5'-phosphate oxidase family protein [Roseobacter litoralis]|uniref:Pyridoxamine 5'-phosphate oxidase-like protein n=1 Tax=Roseobacter litoralis (strain ATCC 49566 / DSM 6996 / JCM 21268 / NBRC 15278 / OCh 149) TaxID=391595 RepID=F7ZCR7_ROSLO|nr:pyridoxamine 5'-phosphate oxidase family protein [Roseobacter litoralis]AEI94491.1 pyridoxamine 5'-phosphate oxidase-like protein [Roseobacter litoralis Och 149]
MATQYEELNDTLTRFIEMQHIFFCATAGPAGRVNVSPKGMDSLRVLGPNRIIWRNLTGSGNETAGHLAQINRMTLMWCGFEKKPMILRTYGSARTLHRRDTDFDALNAEFPLSIAARQIYDVTIDMVQTSCGYAVPFMDYAGERDVLANWAEDKGPDGISEYWETRNQTTIDDDPTFILAPAKG